MSSTDDGTPALALVALAAIVQQVEDGHGGQIIQDFAAFGQLTLEHEGIAVVIISVVAYPITSPEGNDDHGST